MSNFGQKQKIGGKIILLVSIIKMTYLGICIGSINCMSVITFGLITHNYAQFDLN